MIDELKILIRWYSTALLTEKDNEYNISLFPAFVPNYLLDYIYCNFKFIKKDTYSITFKEK